MLQDRPDPVDKLWHDGFLAACKNWLSRHEVALDHIM
jgi:hypothetical protein